MMKKIMTVLAAAGLLLTTAVSVSAATLRRTNGGNGAVKLTINLNDGFVGALDATLELSGKVMLDTIEWDSSLSNDYVKKYSYDKKSNTVRLYVASGDAARNLADKNGDVVIGVVKVKAAADKEKFNVGIKRLSVTNMDYEVRDITKLENDKTGDFTFRLEDVNNGNNNSGGNSNNSGNNSNGGNSNSNSGNKDNGDSSNAGSGTNQSSGANGSYNSGNSAEGNKEEVAKTDKEKDKDEAVKDNFDNSDPIKSNGVNGSYDSTDTSDNHMIWYIGFGILIVILVGAGGYVVYRQNQKA